MEKKDTIKLNESDLRRIIKDSVDKTFSQTRPKTNMDIVSLFNLDSISDEELESQYVDLAFTVSSSGYGGKFMGANGKIIKEEATMTLSVEETRKEIQNKFHF